MAALWKKGTKVHVTTGGRNNTGQITVRHRGGGVRKKLRKITWILPIGETFLVKGLDYDPNRTCLLAWVEDVQSKENYYTLGTKEMKVGDYLTSIDTNVFEEITLEIEELYDVKLPQEHGTKIKSITKNKVDAWVAEQKTRVIEEIEEITEEEENPKGVILTENNYHWIIPLKWIPLGVSVCNIGGKWIRAGGTSGRILEKEWKGLNRVLIQIPSGEVRWMRGDLKAQIGILAKNKKVGQPIKKAGVKRRIGIRPTVRGVAINPVDHPHGGGEGKASGGRPSVTPWGKVAKGQPTRRKEWSNWVTTPRLRAWQKKALERKSSKKIKKTKK
jgi:ribosomal protein L2